MKRLLAWSLFIAVGTIVGMTSDGHQHWTSGEVVIIILLSMMIAKLCILLTDVVNKT